MKYVIKNILFERKWQYLLINKMTNCEKMNNKINL